MLRCTWLGVWCAVALMVAMSTTSHAVTTYNFVFSGVSNNGTGSAEMDIELDGNTMTVKVRNTSPTTYNGSNTNLASIFAFGFNFDGAVPTINSWSMSAFDASNASITIGDSNQSDGVDFWNIELNDSLEGVTLDFFPQNSGPDANTNVSGGLYNPALAGTIGDSEGANRHFFSEAILTVVFDAPPVLDLTPGSDPNPYVRMQRVGNGGSLKLQGQLVGDDDDDDDDDFPPDTSTPPGAAPEPLTGGLGALALGAVGYCLLRRRA